MTSLAQQLKRLQAPQTNILKDSKKRASLLFDPKEAANKDRETIYEIGLSGLEELISLNTSFAQFESNLFDKTSRDVQRAVETIEINKKLNKTIKKFLLQLSPYFLLQSAHKCLEWLIRRFQIHEYNKDELMMLILPYHETRIFVRCVQLLDVDNEHDKWHWLKPIQKPGVPLPKQTIFNRAASDPWFLQFIGTCVKDAIKALDVRAHTLQTIFGFYCTTIIGTLYSIQKIQEIHITSIMPTLLKGLSSNIIDFVAASYMIVGQLVSKLKFNKKLLDTFLIKISYCQHTILQIDSVMLLVLIFSNQSEEIAEIPEEAFNKILENTWFSSVLRLVSQQGVNVTTFYIKLTGQCLRNIQLKDTNWVSCKNLIENLLLDIEFTEQDAELVIRSGLDNYTLREKPPVSNNDSVIMLDSDDDAEDSGSLYIDDNNLGVSKWYSEYLKKLERQYPDAFDKVIKLVMKGDNGVISKGKKTALKAVLGFLLKAAYNDDETNVFENLYHHSAQQRILAIKYLAHNFCQMNITPESQDLFRDSILERLNDQNPDVVQEILKMNINKLLNLIGEADFIERLIKILTKGLINGKLWRAAIDMAVQLLLSPELLRDVNSNRIFIGIFPFLFPTSDTEFKLYQKIVNSGLSKHIQFIKGIKTETENITDHRKVTEKIHEILNNHNGKLPDVKAIMEIIETQYKVEMHPLSVFYNTILLSYTLPKNSSPELSRRVLELAFKCSANLKCKFDSATIVDAHNNIRHNIFSNEIFILAILEILHQTKLQKIKTFVENPEVLLILKIYEILLIKGCSTNESSDESAIFLSGLSKFLHILFDNVQETLNFCLNYFGGHAMAPTFGITAEIQMWTVKLAQQILENSENDELDELTINDMVHILFGLNNVHQAIRQEVIGFIEKLVEKSKYARNSKFWNEIMNHQEEIICDPEQISLILYKILTQKAKCYQDIWNLLTEILVNPESSKYVVANLLKLLKHVNTVKNLPKLCEIGNEIYEKMENSEDVILSSYDSDILRNLIYRFNHETVKVISISKPALSFILNTLNNHKFLMQNDTKVSSPASLLLEVIDDESYQKLTNEYKIILINSIVRTATYCEFNDITVCAHKLMKKLDINCKIIENLLMEMKNVEDKRANKDKRKFTLSVEILSTESWKKGVTLLEFLQNKKKLKNVEIVIPHLFDILKKCLNFEEQSPVEYVKQLLLSCILHCCEKISPDGTSKRDIIPDSMFHIDLVVKCIRATQNPQTHHHALLLLCHTALMIPEQVLHNMMDIFTFMGSSVVRHDDAYSFQIITKIIEKIIPILTKANETTVSDAERETLTIPVLKIFADIILDVPEHRRIPLYVKLIKTLDSKMYLWKFLAVVFESQVKDKKVGSAETDDKLPRRLDIALSIAKEFDLEIIIQTCTEFLEYLKSLPVDRPEDVQSMNIDITDTSIFLVEAHTSKQLRHFKYIICQFIGILTSSPQFVNRVAALTENEVKHMKSFYQNFIIKILIYIADVSKATEKFSDSTQHRYWKVILHHCYDILDNAISLLSTDIFLLVVHGLLRHKMVSVRKRVIDLLISKIQHKSDFIEKCETTHLVQIIEPLCSIFEEINESDTMETYVLQQTALIAIKLLSKVLCNDHPDEFKDILDKVINISLKCEKLPKFLHATVILCLSEICVNLRANSLSNLPTFMPILIDSLKKQVGADTNDPLLIASMVAIHKIIESIPLFLSPYIKKIITILSNISSVNDDEKIQNRLTQIFSKIGSTIPGRVLIPSIDKSYQTLIKNQKYKSIPGVMKIVSNSFDNMTSDELGSLQSDLSNFFMNALQFRSTCDDLYVVNLIEAEVIKAFVCLILKLSESTFRPLYYKIYDWAIREGGDEHKARSITFYNLSSHIADALKSLFTLFADSFIHNAADLLSNVNYFDGLDFSAEKSALLIEYIMKTLNLVFLHDSHNFMNANRFNILMQPIVDQIENPSALKDEKLQKIISLCISQLAVAANDDSLWKQLNYQVLLKTRTNDPNTRLFALKTCVEIARKLGEDFLPFLPETIPFLAELLEDENYMVEKSSQQAVQELEKIVGEPLQKYF